MSSRLLSPHVVHGVFNNSYLPWHRSDPEGLRVYTRIALKGLTREATRDGQPHRMTHTGTCRKKKKNKKNKRPLGRSSLASYLSFDLPFREQSLNRLDTVEISRLNCLQHRSWCFLFTRTQGGRSYVLWLCTDTRDIRYTYEQHRRLDCYFHREIPESEKRDPIS